MRNKISDIKDFLVYAVPVMAVDLLIHIAVFKWVSSVFDYEDPADLIMKNPKVVYFLVISFLLTMALIPVNLHKREILVRVIVWRACLQTLVTLSLFAISIYILNGSFAGRLFFREGLAATVVICIWHLLSRWTVVKLHRKNRLDAVIVGSGQNAIRLYDTLTDWDSCCDYRVLGFFSPGSEDLPESAQYLGDYSKIAGYLEDNRTDAVFCGINPARNPDIVREIIKVCENSFIDFYYVPDMDGYLHRTMTYREIGHVLMFQLRDEPLSNPVNIAVKRLFDIVVSILFLTTFFPVIFAVVAVGTRISSPGPVFFRQKRTGYRGDSFTMLKFRSMKVNSEADRIQATDDDPRKTRFGDFLRRTSIDELPQFINVLKGDMSIIGPRPHMEYHTEMYRNLVDEYMVRHMVKPGITGWAQVNGCRGETREVEQMARRVRYDIWYVEHWSPYLDLKIILLTILQIVRGDRQAY